MTLMCVLDASLVRRSHACCASSRAALNQQEAKEIALRDTPPPSGFTRCVIPGKTANRSIVYDHGVRFEQEDVFDEYEEESSSFA